jgi:hypothetical protein
MAQKALLFPAGYRLFLTLAVSLARLEELVQFLQHRL